MENVAYHFSQDAFSPILNGQATVVAVNQKTLPALARVEVLYQVYTSDKTLLTSGMVPVSLASGRGEMALQIAIPVMIIDADNISIQLTPHRWYPVYLARPAL
jgi:hypothetical protein